MPKRKTVLGYSPEKLHDKASKREIGTFDYLCRIIPKNKKGIYGMGREYQRQLDSID